MMRCSMTDREYPDHADGIWDDGEWISWDWINAQLHAQELREQYPHAQPEVVEIFEQLVSAAEHYRQITGRYLQVWGELGELYAQIAYGVKLHRPHTRGSDGKLGNDYVEVKTISPEKAKARIAVKRAGNFNKVLIVRISEEFKFEARLVDRKVLKKGTGKLARLAWPAGETEPTDVPVD
jgi:hypothetical protein